MHLHMTQEQLSKKRVLFFLMIAYFIVGYLSCSYFNLHRDHYFNVALPFESMIPFKSFFLLGYISVYVGLILVYAVIDDYAYFKKGLLVFAIVSTVHFIFFILVPVRIARPDLTAATGVMDILTRYYYLIDNPVNCFPSLHVSYPLVGTLVLWPYKRRWGYLMAVLTAFIAVSVVLVKQHYILDVVGAAIVTGLVFWAIKRKWLT